MSRVLALCRALVALLPALWLAGCGGGTGAAATLPAPGVAASGGHVERLLLASAALNKDMAVDVYLPPGYNATQNYPVLYLLYGYGGNQDSFFGGFLSMHRVADTMIAAGSIAPLIIVVPNYDNSFGVNSSVAQNPNSAGASIGPYEDYLTKEVLPYVDQHYSTSARREKRYVGGMSMGGYAALYLGLSHPDLFSKVGAHSAALWDYSSTDQFTGQRDWLYATPELRALRDPMLLARHVDVSGLRFYLDAGSSDALRPKDEEMAGILGSVGAAVEWHTSSGGHDGAYWSGQLANYLAFYN